MPENAPAQKFDFSKYKSILWRRKWWGIVPLAVLMLATVIVAGFAPKKYPASCLIYMGTTQEEQDVDPYTTRVTRTQISRIKFEGVRNRMLMYGNVRELILGAEGTPGIRGLAEKIDRNNQVEVEELIEEIQSDVKIVQSGDEYVEISYLGDTPDLARDVVGGLVDRFLDGWMGLERKARLDSLERSKRNVRKYYEELESVYNRLRDFREQHAVELSMREAGYLGRRLEETASRLDEIDSELKIKAEKRNFLMELLENTQSTIERSITYQRSPKKARYDDTVAGLEIERILMKDHYTDDNPRAKKLDSQIQALGEESDKLQDERTATTFEPNKTYDDLRKQKNDVELDIKQLEEERKARLAQRDKLQENARLIPAAQEQEAKFEGQRLNTFDLYKKAWLNQEDAQRRLELAEVAKINSFEKLSLRVSPRADTKTMLKWLMIGTFLSLAVSFAAVLGAEYLDQSFSTVDDARDFLQLPSLGAVPIIVTTRDKRNRRLAVCGAIGAVVLIVGGAVAAFMFSEDFHGWVMDLARDVWHRYKDLMPW